ncbi:MAG: hypothetical protein COX80_02780 [Candidatus Magasanikbacteria bacterium CG_4_10_14_0_2_um_filter_33_14]|uniref:Uncharacterized protein n=1 Tax=Candidatus Magasanikbacteria bacterium CG_4_10_14_0_2_um_filter_33_14 TaxID=1974636 RepID=A0A2M7VAP6_9BACT|nr:MAG: hypothetical protein COX80_02780 [Candidatus Magasanikbacteria bacterium CG_4_10_14_0_2_um_filter_33_14]
MSVEARLRNPVIEAWNLKKQAKAEAEAARLKAISEEDSHLNKPRRTLEKDNQLEGTPANDNKFSEEKTVEVPLDPAKFAEQKAREDLGIEVFSGETDDGASKETRPRSRRAESASRRRTAEVRRNKEIHQRKTAQMEKTIRESFGL